MAGNVETLTQRYWECMLTKTIILGHAPQELIEFAGYNPVIEIEWNDVGQQIDQILLNIESYQELVDKNFEFARKFASWDIRATKMIELLVSDGYKFNEIHI
jgi:arginyl-tRNA synthetase